MKAIVHYMNEIEGGGINNNSIHQGSQNSCEYKISKKKKSKKGYYSGAFNQHHEQTSKIYRTEINFRK